MSASPHPHFFIVRPDGTKTPLIAVDELPSNFHILGVPPCINDAQTQGMVSLGLVPSSGRCYVVQQDANSPTSPSSLGPSSQSDSDKHGPGLPRKYKAPDAGLGSIESLSPAQHVFDNSQERCGSSSTSYGRDTASRTKWHHPEPCVDETQAIIDAVTRVSSKTSTQQDQHTAEPPTAGFSQPTRGKKIYCNYWLRKGECDYMQQGCLYKHEMPLDKATLADLGLRDVPRWYREQWASVAASNRTQREDHVNRPWRASKSPCSFSSVQPDAPRALSPASATSGPTQIRQLRVLPSTLSPPPAIHAQKGFELSEQRQISNSNGTTSSTTQSYNCRNGSRLGLSKDINTAQPVQPGSITHNTPINPTRATGQYQPAHQRPEHRYRHQRERAPSPDKLLAKVPAMMPSCTQILVQQTALKEQRHKSTHATFYPGIPRTSSPAHPRLFVKQGQEKYAVNQSVELMERPKTAAASKADIQHVEKQPSEILNIFGDLGV